MTRRVLIGCALVALLALPTAARCQPRLATDLHLGVGSGSRSGAASSRSQEFLALGVTLAGELRRLPVGRLMAGVALSRQSSGPTGDVAYFQPDGATLGGPWPVFRSLNAVAALNFPGPIAGRFTGGAGAFRDNLGYTTGGLSGSADVTIPGRTRVGLLIAGTSTVLPGYRGGSYRMTSLAVGVRMSSHPGHIGQ